MDSELEISEYKTIYDITELVHKRVIFFDEIDSTNEEAKRILKNESDEEIVIVAELQTFGKGTQGKKWYSPKGSGIWSSLIIKTEQELKDVQKTTLLTGLSVYQVLSNYISGKKLSIKWPNDIHVEDKKICGILIESVKNSKGTFLVVGIGINVNTEKFDDFTGNTPTSIFLETGRVSSRKEILKKLIEKVYSNYNEYMMECKDFIDEYKMHCKTLNSQVNIERNGQMVTGKAADILQTGELLVDNGNEIIKIV